MDLDANPETLELLDDLVATGLVESTGYVLRPLGKQLPTGSPNGDTMANIAHATH